MGWTGIFTDTTKLPTKQEIEKNLTEEYLKGVKILAKKVTKTKAWIAYQNPGETQPHVVLILIDTKPGETLFKPISPYYIDENETHIEDYSCPKHIAQYDTSEEGKIWQKTLEKSRKAKKELIKKLKNGHKIDETTFYWHPTKKIPYYQNPKDGKYYKENLSYLLNKYMKEKETTYKD